MFTLRNRSGQSHVSRCVGYEFEDVVCAIDEISVVAPASDKQGRVKEILRELALELDLNRLPIGKSIKNTRFYKRLGTGSPSELRIDECELLICDVLFAQQLLAIQSIQGWRANSRYAACWVEEMWRQDVETLAPEIDVLQQFDHVFCSCAGTVERLAERLQRPVTYLPPAVDAITFCPWPNPRSRSIDVCGVGRRSAITHEALLRYARDRNGFYYYDTIHGPFLVGNPAEHRLLYSNILKTSRYFIANHAKFNSSDEINGQQEIGYRFFEGMAAGAVLLGDHPDTQVFQDQLGWPDSVIRIPFDCPHVSDVLEQLDRDPVRLEEIRRRNVINVLRRHDWLHRWSVILETFGLPGTEGMEARRQQLDELRDQIERAAG
ncbi:MAG: glycosyltransferase family protein [Kiloniellales bacterium]